MAVHVERPGKKHVGPMVENTKVALSTRQGCISCGVRSNGSAGSREGSRARWPRFVTCSRLAPDKRARNHRVGIARRVQILNKNEVFIALQMSIGVSEGRQGRLRFRNASVNAELKMDAALVYERP
jgi:hypothetical protein